MALTIGIPHELFWELSLREVEMVVDQWLEHQRSRTLRAAWVVATILNVHRKRGAPWISPHDLVRTPRKEEDFLSVEQSRVALDAWAAGANAAQEVAPPKAKETPE